MPVAGLASVHGCIGAVDPVRTFGSPEQKQETQSLTSCSATQTQAASCPCLGRESPDKNRFTIRIP